MGPEKKNDKIKRREMVSRKREGKKEGKREGRETGDGKKE